MPSPRKKKLVVTARRTAKLTAFAARLLTEWQRLELPTSAGVIVAVSGGADSCALLLALDELLKAKRLSPRLTVAHLNHGLRGKASKEDAEWVGNLARHLGYEVEIAQANVKKRAKDTSDNLEQAARRARYEFLPRISSKKKADVLLTAHTLVDQAETVLLNLLRGS